MRSAAAQLWVMETHLRRVSMTHNGDVGPYARGSWRRKDRRGRMSQRWPGPRSARGGGGCGVLQQRRGRGHAADPLYCDAAAAGGQLEALQCALALGCPWDERTCSRAAGGGHLAVLQWARAQDPPCLWDEETCSEAAGGGHLAVLQWVRAQEPPCPWVAWICGDRAGDSATAEWIDAQAAREGGAL
ncbi:hypothetical protein Rsub_05398 [Raphidocelis subcapitata]|uniref:Ankyrin repeat domain-containing protein n=1 Tax=Raphidocelis subcapitata TaxID=307507 RepID=A0A2V0NZM9_9CHLO|nr:hypothetical protein Rsub_05398 [Raphidocelis subcapitata]|eukprot:GBF92779.1 hypothetical protein Rsub_05398 [Raphidocelis subcapitata]